MRRAGCDAVAMEVQRHALALGRVDGHDVRRRRLHQPQPGPPRLPPDDWRTTSQPRPDLFTPAASRHGVVDVDDEWGRLLARTATVPVTTVSPAGRRRGLASGRRRARGRTGSTFRAVGPAGARGGRERPAARPVQRRQRPAAPSSPSTPRACRWTPRPRGSPHCAGVPGRMERVDCGPAVPRARRLRAHPRRRRARCSRRSATGHDRAGRRRPRLRRRPRPAQAAADGRRSWRRSPTSPS